MNHDFKIGDIIVNNVTMNIGYINDFITLHKFGKPCKMYLVVYFGDIIGSKTRLYDSDKIKKMVSHAV